MIPRALMLVTATAALAAPAAGQAVPGADTPVHAADAQRLDFAPSIAVRPFLVPPRVTVVPEPQPVRASHVRIRLSEELRRYQRQRTLGGGVAVVGAAALAAALFEWAGRDAFGMSSGATAAFMGGTGLLFLGAELRRVATQRIALAEARPDGAAQTGTGNR